MTQKQTDKLEVKVDAMMSLMRQHFNRFDQAITSGDRDRAETKAWREDISDRMEKTEVELFFWKTVIKILKTLGVVGVLILTLKFGEIKGLFK